MNILIALAGALALAAPVAAQTQDEKAFNTAVAAAMREKLPLPLTPGFVMTRADAVEGIVVVLVEYRGEAPLDGSAANAAQELGRGLATGICQSGEAAASDLFARGLVVRADLLLPSKETITGPVVDRCPE